MPIALASLAIVLAATVSAPAELVIRQLDIVLDNDDYSLDLDQDGVADFFISDFGGEGSEISPIIDTNHSVVGNGNTFLPTIFSLGDPVDFNSGEPVFGFATLSGFGDAPFNQIGSSGFIGLSLSEGENTNFGFLEITRGSTILGVVGYETTPGVAAVVTVPEPATGTALAALFTAAAVRRRRC